MHVEVLSISQKDLDIEGVMLSIWLIEVQGVGQRLYCIGQERTKVNGLIVAKN